MVGNDAGGRLKAHTWRPVVTPTAWCESRSISRCTSCGRSLLRKLMTERGLEAPPVGRTLERFCIVGELCDDIR